MTVLFKSYTQSLSKTVSKIDVSAVKILAQELLHCWKEGRQVFLCGNGGSSSNAIHAANDLIYGIGQGAFPGLKAHALPANSSVLTCLANDEGYEHIYSKQLASLAKEKDVLIVMSGSGNSPNIIEALKTAKQMKLKSFSLLGFDGGKAKSLSDTAIHFEIDDMQISEDLQMVVIHMITKWLIENYKDDRL